jgi:transcriptional regulator GlxA family with amidase domain
MQPKTKKQPLPLQIQDETITLWLNQLEEVVFNNLDNFNFTTEQLAEDLNMSKRQLLRRIKSRIGMTPSQYIKTIRLTKARALLQQETYASVKEVAYTVGYKDVAYFSKLFKQEFGKLPSEYL